MYFYIFRHYVLGITWLDTFICFCVCLRYICSKFSAAILAAILENMQLVLLLSKYLISTSFIPYESLFYSSLYLKAKLRYIRFRFSAAILAAVWETMQLLLLFSKDLISAFFISCESTLHSLFLGTCMCPTAMVFCFVKFSGQRIHSDYCHLRDHHVWPWNVRSRHSLRASTIWQNQKSRIDNDVIFGFQSQAWRSRNWQ